jgi:putative endonuclease
MAISQKRQFGDLGEKVATKYLEKKGYTILESNYQNKFGRRLGEIDIIAKDKETVVFVEVKTRDWKKYSQTLPEENITHSKLRKLDKIASVYLRHRGLQSASYRFDALSVWLDRVEKKAKIKHIPSL